MVLSRSNAKDFINRHLAISFKNIYNVLTFYYALGKGAYNVHIRQRIFHLKLFHI